MVILNGLSTFYLPIFSLTNRNIEFIVNVSKCNSDLIFAWFMSNYFRPLHFTNSVNFNFYVWLQKHFSPIWVHPLHCSSLICTNQVIQQLRGRTFIQLTPPPSSGQKWKFYILSTVCHMTNRGLSTDPPSPSFCPHSYRMTPCVYLD